MTDHKALIAEAQDALQAWATWQWEHKLVSRLADALEAANPKRTYCPDCGAKMRDRAVVEAQALEQTADEEAEYWRQNAQDHEVTVVMRILWRLRARAVEIREGRQ